MQLIRRIIISLAAIGILALSACSSPSGSSTASDPLHGTVVDVGGQDDSYSIQLEGSDKVWSCYAVNAPVCRLLKVGDQITFTKFNETAMNQVTRTARTSN